MTGSTHRRRLATVRHDPDSPSPRVTLTNNDVDPVKRWNHCPVSVRALKVTWVDLLSATNSPLPSSYDRRKCSDWSKGVSVTRTQWVEKRCCTKPLVPIRSPVNFSVVFVRLECSKNLRDAHWAQEPKLVEKNLLKLKLLSDSRTTDNSLLLLLLKNF